MNDDRMFLGVAVVWLIGALLVLAFWIVVIWAAVHFIRKWW